MPLPHLSSCKIMKFGPSYIFSSFVSLLSLKPRRMWMLEQIQAELFRPCFHVLCLVGGLCPIRRLAVSDCLSCLDLELKVCQNDPSIMTFPAGALPLLVQQTFIRFILSQKLKVYDFLILAVQIKGESSLKKEHKLLIPQMSFYRKEVRMPAFFCISFCSNEIRSSEHQTMTQD